MTKRVDIYRVPAERWKQGPSQEWMDKRAVMQRGYKLFFELALSTAVIGEEMSRIYEHRLIEEIRRLGGDQLVPALATAASLGLASVLAVHTGPLAALHARACVLRCLEIARGRPRLGA